jgi:ribosome-binding factor A
MPSHRTARIGEQIRTAVAQLLAREVRDPGIGFVTITDVKVTPDLQQARVHYTTMGDEKVRRESQRALERATPMLRRHLGRSLRLKRVPELQFFFDESIERLDRIERILQELDAERNARPTADDDPGDHGGSDTD